MRSLTLIHSLFNQLLPLRCQSCHTNLGSKIGISLCDYCHYALPWLGHACQICALPLVDKAANTCGQCLVKPPSFISARIPFRYSYPLDKLILDFKFNRGFTQGKLLSDLMIDFLIDDYQEQSLPDLLVPIPLHFWRRCTRGFNQSEILAKDLSRAFHIPIMNCSRKFQKHTQKESDKKSREQNLRNAFHISQRQQIQIQGRHIAIIDDVMTTGATAREMSKTLLNKGAASVVIWAIARTPLSS